MAENEKKLDTIIEGVKHIQEKNNSLESRLDTTEAEQKAALETAKTAVTDAMQEMQDVKQKIAAQEQTFNMFQKELLSGGTNGHADPMIKEYDQHLARYFKRGEAIPEQEMKNIIADIVSKSVHGADSDSQEMMVKALSSGSGPDGGFFVTAERSANISMRMFETSPIRPYAMVENSSKQELEVVLDDDEPDAGWVGEVQARPNTDTAQVGLVKIPLHELYAQPRITQRLVDDDGFDVVSWHQGKVARRFGRIENAAFVNGDGSQKPKGFLTYPEWTTAGLYQRNAVERRASTVSQDFGADDLFRLQGDLIEDYQMEAMWAMHRETFHGKVLTLKGTDGHYLINYRALAEGGQMMLLGKNVAFFNDMAAPNASQQYAADSPIMTYANFMDFYCIVDGIGIRVLRDPYTNKPYIRFYTTKRTGGAVVNYEAGKILKALT